MKLKKRLLGVPVQIVSHASPAHRGRVGPIRAVRWIFAQVEVRFPEGRIEYPWVNFRGLRAFRKKVGA